jgi:hypothetical protein
MSAIEQDKVYSPEPGLGKKYNRFRLTLIALIFGFYMATDQLPVWYGGPFTENEKLLVNLIGVLTMIAAALVRRNPSTPAKFFGWVMGTITALTFVAWIGTVAFAHVMVGHACSDNAPGACEAYSHLRVIY